MSARKIRSSWWVDFRFRGVRYRKRSPHNTKAAAREYENTLRLALAAGEDPFAEENRDTTRTTSTVAEFAEEWFTSYVCANNKRSEQRTKRSLLRNHIIPWFGAMALDEVSAEDLEAYKSAKRASGLTAKTVNNHLTVLTKLLNSAADWGRITSVPRTRLMKTAPPRFKVLDDAELAQLLFDHTEPRWNAMALIAARTGMRLSELRGLTWADVDFDRGLVSVRGGVVGNYVESTKTYRSRHVPMTSDVRQLLLGMREPEGYVFRRPDGRFVGAKTAAKALGRMCKRTGVRHIGWHALRHSFATSLATRGVPLHEVQALLGHTTIITTMRYAHVAPGRLQESIRVLEQARAHPERENLGQPAGNTAAACDETRTRPPDIDDAIRA